jgi:hypothetical protein
MRKVALGLLVVAAFTGPCLGQQKVPPSTGATLPPGSVLQDSCVEVEIDGTKTFDCLNGKLKNQVERVVPVPNMPPIGTQSQDIQLGITNMPAVRQQYGPNFGKSVVPYRPPPPVYSPPLGK